MKQLELEITAGAFAKLMEEINEKSSPPVMLHRKMQRGETRMELQNKDWHGLRPVIVNLTCPH